MYIEFPSFFTQRGFERVAHWIPFMHANAAAFIFNQPSPAWDASQATVKYFIQPKLQRDNAAGDDALQQTLSALFVCVCVFGHLASVFKWDVFGEMSWYASLFFV